MYRSVITVASLVAALTVLPTLAAAQCEGGTSAAGYYLTNGAYMPGGCAYVNSATPGQLYPSGAQPLPSTSPALGASALPGQPYAAGLIPAAGGTAQVVTGVGPQTPSLGPGAPGIGPIVSIPQGPSTGVTALPGHVARVPAPPFITVTQNSTLNSTNPAYGFSLPAAPPRTEESPATEELAAPAPWSAGLARP
jgi:hypothetical protein